MFCTSCGGQVKEGATFCTGCGAKVGGGGTVQETPAPRAQTPAAPLPAQRSHAGIQGFLGALVGILLLGGGWLLYGQKLLDGHGNQDDQPTQIIEESKRSIPEEPIIEEEPEEEVFTEVDPEGLFMDEPDVQPPTPIPSPTPVAQPNPTPPSREMQEPDGRQISSPNREKRPGDYFVILGGFRHADKPKSVQYQERLQTKGYANHYIIDSDQYPNLRSGLWVVVMGPYPKAEAEREMKKMKISVSDCYVKSGW